MRKRLFLFVALASLLGFYGCSDKTSVIDEPEVNTSGGTFMVGDVKFEIPDGALDKEIKLTAKEIANPKDLPSLKRPSEMVAAFEFGPDGTEFKKPVKVTVTLPKAMKSGKYLVSTYIPKDDIWEGVGYADIKGNEATFEVTHFSHYAVTAVDAASITALYSIVRSGTMSGKNEYLITKEIEQKLIHDMNILYRWDVGQTNGVFYKPISLSVRFMTNIVENGHSRDGQGVLHYGQGDYLDYEHFDEDKNWTSDHVAFTGIAEETQLIFDYMSSDSKIIERHGKTIEEVKKDYQKIVSIGIERKMEAIDPIIELTEKNTLASKGDEDEIELYMYVQHTGKSEVWNSSISACHWNDGNFTQDYDTPFGTYETAVTLKDSEPDKLGPEGEPKYDYPNQEVEVSVLDPKQVKILDLENVKGEKNVFKTTTDEKGKATIKIEALENNINTDFLAEWEYNFQGPQHNIYEDYTDHAAAQKKLHLGSSTWTIYGMMSYGEYHLRDTTGEWFEEVHNDAGFDIIYEFQVGPFVADGDWMDDGTGNMCLVRTACSIDPLVEPNIEKGYCYHTDLDVEEDNKDYYYDFANWGTNSYSSDDMAYVFLKETKTGIKALFQFVYQDWWKNVLFWYEDRNGSKYAYPALSRIMFPLVEGRYPIEYDENFIDTHFEECRDDVALHAAGEGHLGTLYVMKDSNNPEDIKQAKERLRKAHMAKLAKLRKSTATHAKTAPHERR